MNRVLALVLLATAATQAATTIGGEIGNTVLEESAGPYVVEKDLVVAQGATLSIQPGAVLLFKPFTGVRVEGSLVVEGSAQKPAVFTSVNDNRFGPATGQLPNPFDWNGITLGTHCTGARLRNLHVLYGVYGINAQTANVLVEDCVFSQNGQFNLKVVDKLEYALDNTPYSYGADAHKQARSAVQKSGTKEKSPATEEASSAGKAFRIVCLGAAVAGAAVGTVFAVQAGNARDALARAGSSADWESLDQQRQSRTIGAWVSYGCGALFLAGFAVSFAF